MPFYDRILEALSIASQKPQHAPSSVYPPNTSTERNVLVPPARRYNGPALMAIHGDISLYSRQADSPLFERLPLELRDYIWELLLGHHTIHLFWHDRDTLRGFICPRRQADGAQQCTSIQHDAGRANALLWTGPSHIYENAVDQKKGFMPLLLTCRAAYFEASRVLYATNVFDFSDHWPLFHTRLAFSIPLRSINHITHVTVTAYSVPLPTTPPLAEFVAWTKLWDLLSLFQSLRCLEVELVPARGRTEHKGPPRDALCAAANEFLAPVLKMNDLARRMKNGKAKWVIKVPFDDVQSRSGVWGTLEHVGWTIVSV